MKFDNWSSDLSEKEKNATDAVHEASVGLLPALLIVLDGFETTVLGAVLMLLADNLSPAFWLVGLSGLWQWM